MELSYVRTGTWMLVTLWLTSTLIVAVPIISSTSPDVTTQVIDVSTEISTASANTQVVISSETPSPRTSLAPKPGSTKVASEYHSSPSTSSTSLFTTKPSSSSSGVPHSKSTVVSYATQSTIGSSGTTKANEAVFSIWKGLSIGLGALCVLVILAFMMTIAVLCRLRGQLRRVNKTLYPATPSEHVYTDLQPANRRSDKRKSMKVELQAIKTSNIDDNHSDDEIHSPMDEPSIASPFTDGTASAIGSNQAPPVNDRLPKGSATSAEVLNRASSSTESSDHIYENEGFENDGKGLYDKEDDNIYEDYSYSDVSARQDASSAGVTIKGDNTDTRGSETLNKDQMLRQNSLSGLPESILQRVSSQLGTDGMPLQDIDEDFVHNVDSGIPMGDTVDGVPSDLRLRDSDTYEPVGDNDVMNDNRGIRSNIVDSNDVSNETGYKGNNVNGHTQNSNNDTSLDDGRIDIKDTVPLTSGKPDGDSNFANTSEFDFLPVYDDGLAGTPVDRAVIDDDVQLYEDNDAQLFNQFDGHPLAGNLYAGHGPTGPFDDEGIQLEGQVGLTDGIGDSFQAQFPDIVVTRSNSNGLQGMTGINTETGDYATKTSNGDILLKTSSQGFMAETSNGRLYGTNSTASLTDLDPLGMLKSNPIRLRTDSSSTPDKYYLDLEDVTPVLKVEDSKRISSQFPSDFYIKNMDNMYPTEDINTNHINNQFDTTASNNPFGDNNHVGQTDGQMSQPDVLQEFDNAIYSNLVSMHQTDPFGDESET